MKTWKKNLAILFIVSMLVSALPTNVQAASKSEIKLSKKSLTLYVGKTATLKLKGTKKTPKWSSSKKSVATVTKKGKIKAKKKGTTVITAKLGKKKYKCKVTVKKDTRGNSTPQKQDSSVPSNNNTNNVTVTPSVASNYQKLASYLMKNGLYDSDTGDYFIGGIADESISDWYAMINYTGDGSYEFIIMYSSDSVTNIITLVITPPEYAKGAVVNIYVSSSSDTTYYAQGMVTLSSLTIDNKSITYTDTNAPTTALRDSLYSLGESALGIGLYSWNNILKNTNLGMSLKDLGFTSY